MKMELGICKGKQLHDKRDAMAKRDSDREIQRTLRERQKDWNGDDPVSTGISEAW